MYLDLGTFWGFLSLCRSHLPPVPRCRCRYRPSFLPSFLSVRGIAQSVSRGHASGRRRSRRKREGGNGDSQKMSIAAHFQTRSKKVCLFMAAQIGAVLVMQRCCLGRERSGCWHACLSVRSSVVRPSYPIWPFSLGRRRRRRRMRETRPDLIRQ